MTRVYAALLLVALLVSSLYLVGVSYQARRLFGELDAARAEQRKLDAEFKRLDAERQAQATNLRVDKVARDRLGMHPATPAVTQFVVDAGATAAAAGGAR
jgi:cell division protein FtsL